MCIGIGDWVLMENYAKYAVLPDISHFVVSVEVPFHVCMCLCLNCFTLKIAQFVKKITFARSSYYFPSKSFSICMARKDTNLVNQKILLSR